MILHATLNGFSFFSCNRLVLARLFYFAMLCTVHSLVLISILLPRNNLIVTKLKSVGTLEIEIVAPNPQYIAPTPKYNALPHRPGGGGGILETVKFTQLW